jgi:hypothetical protein
VCSPSFGGLRGRSSLAPSVVRGVDQPTGVLYTEVRGWGISQASRGFGLALLFALGLRVGRQPVGGRPSQVIVGARTGLGSRRAY